MTSNPIVTLFYRRLLDLDPNQEVAPQLEEALRLLVQVTSASAGYLELFGADEPLFSRTVGLSADELRPIRDAISRGLIAHAIAEGRTTEMSATARGLPSELVSAGVAFACVPIAHDATRGVVYLQRPKRKFSAVEVEFAELFAKRTAPLCALLVPPRTLDEQLSAFKQLVIRQELRRNGWNKTTAARLLGVGRAALYRALRSK